MPGLRLLAVVVLCGCSMEPSNTDLGLHVGAEVVPRQVSLTDSAAALSLRVLVSNPSDRAILVQTGGPPLSLPEIRATAMACPPPFGWPATWTP